MPESVTISKEDMENHNKEGGVWLVIDNKVYDAQPLISQVSYVLV